jgi:hypothetical protein
LSITVTIIHCAAWKGNLPPLVNVAYSALPFVLLMPPWLHDPYILHCDSQFGHQLPFKNKWRNKLFLKKPRNPYSFASDAGNFGDEFSVLGLSRRYEPDIASKIIQSVKA